MKELILSLIAAGLPLVLQAIGLVLATLIGLAANVARTRWNIEIEARHREALHSALMSGATAALSRGLSWGKAKASVLEYAQRSVPQAIAALDPDYSVLSALAEAKLHAAGGHPDTLQPSTG